MGILLRLKNLLRLYKWYNKHFSKENIGYLGGNAMVEYPIHVESPKDLYLYENAKIRNNVSIINAPGEKVIVKKYSVIAGGTTIITNNHRSTVGIPHILLGASHINDKSEDVIIEEDVWVGANTTILSGVTLGRGCIVATGAVVSKSVPPYALVAGIPAKIIAVKFSVEDVLQHERILYSEKERFTKEYLQTLYDKYYQDKKTFGINRSLSADELVHLNKIKKKLGYIDWNNEN